MNEEIGNNRNFISPATIYAKVKEEYRSFFNTNSIDDLLFPVWTQDCIDKMENTYYPIEECVMDMWDGKCDLPCDFDSALEVWMCATYHKGPIVSPFVFYYQTDCRINPAPPSENVCNDCVDGYQCTQPFQTPTPVALPDLCGVPDQYRVTHKVMSQMDFDFRISALLKPRSFSTLGKCSELSPNREAQALDTFDIKNNKLITSFKEGTIYMSYYAKPFVNEAGYPEIPNNDPFKKYVEHYLKYKILEILTLQSTGDDYRMMKDKRQDEEKIMWQKYINAKNYAMAGDIYSVQKAIVRSYNRNNRFKIR